MFSYDNIMNFYKVNFAMVQHHKYSLAEIENMIPWERYVYIDLLSEFLRKQEQDRRDQQAAAKYKKRR